MFKTLPNTFAVCRWKSFRARQSIWKKIILSNTIAQENPSYRVATSKYSANDPATHLGINVERI